IASAVIRASATFRQRCLLKISANSHRRLKKRVSAIDSKPQIAPTLTPIGENLSCPELSPKSALQTNQLETTLACKHLSSFMFALCCGSDYFTGLVFR
ncbi:MAG: hypothetical protein ACHP7O_06420, partial [Burkholderiales bacterium]